MTSLVTLFAISLAVSFVIAVLMAIPTVKDARDDMAQSIEGMIS